MRRNSSLTPIGITGISSYSTPFSSKAMRTLRTKGEALTPWICSMEDSVGRSGQGGTPGGGVQSSLARRTESLSRSRSCA